MGIDRIIDTERRRVVAWLNMPPPPMGRQAFERCEFVVQACSHAELNKPAYLGSLAAVVLTQDVDKPLRITHDLQRHAVRLLNYDCRLIAVPVVQRVDRPALDGHRLVHNALETLRLPTATSGNEPPLPHAQVYPDTGAVRWELAAHSVLRRPPGPPPDWNLTIEETGGQRTLSDEYRLLLRRAFWNCAEVCLRRMDEGHSGVAVYLAHAELAEGQLGRWPLPYFVKIGSRARVLAEYVNYEDKVDPYIPFHLGPHLIRERCCLGARVGVIVGDFVEQSESLAECARSGRGGAAIACLFNDTLAGWHRVAEQRPPEPVHLARRLVGRFPRMRPALQPRIARAQELGATRSLAELARLFRRCDSAPVLVGPIHGDLHAANVRVRGRDAILIDFAAHGPGPIVCDAASLEASLLVEGFGNEVARSAATKAALDRRIGEWLDAISSLYDHVPLESSLIHPNPKNPTCWFHACVRQIRRHAREMEAKPFQYAAALALALLGKATKDLGAPEPEASRRAAAYVLAERVLVHAFEWIQEDYCI